MRLTKKVALWFGIVAAATTGVALAARPERLEVEAARVERAPLEATVDADGRTRVRDRFVVTAPVAGRVERIALEEGDAVRAGDVVARLAPLPLDAAAAIQVRSRVEGAEALAREAATRTRVADAALARRRRDMERTRRVAEAGGLAPRDVEEAALALRQAEEDSSAAVERVRAAAAEVRQSRAALLALGDGRGEAVLVRAPARGRVLRIPERSERVVGAGTPLVEIGDPSTLEVVIDVLSSDGAAVRPGQPVRLEQWGGEGVIAGRVREVQPAAYTKVSALGVDEQRVDVIVDLPRAPAALGDGYRVGARIVTWAAASVPSVPTSAIVREGAGWRAFVVRDGRVRARAVRIGHVGVDAAEVLAGLEVGETVVLFPSDRVAEGIRVNATVRGSPREERP